MSATTEKKGRPTINKPSATETHYSFRKSTNEPLFNRKAKKRRTKAKFDAVNRKKNR